MNRIKRLGLAAAAVSVLAGCSIFENPSPETISISLVGSNGTQVMAIFAQQFVAGINQETSTTEVTVQSADTVMTALPIDTTVNIAASRQLFMQIETMPDDTADVTVRVDVDARNVVNRRGLIFPETPFRYVYQFNRPVTDVVEVVF